MDYLSSILDLSIIGKFYLCGENFLLKNLNPVREIIVIKILKTPLKYI